MQYPRILQPSKKIVKRVGLSHKFKNKDAQLTERYQKNNFMKMRSHERNSGFDKSKNKSEATLRYNSIGSKWKSRISKVAVLAPAIQLFCRIRNYVLSRNILKRIRE